MTLYLLRGLLMNPNINANDISILLVDDVDINNQIMGMIFELYGFKVYTANNGREAIDIIKNKEVSLVFMDRYMPVMDGISAVTEIRELGYSSLPVILLSSDLSEEDINYFKNVGVNKCMIKPVEPDDIINCVNEYLDTGISSNEPAAISNEELINIPGIDSRTGIKNSISEAAYKDNLGMFSASIEDKYNLITDSLKNGDIKRFTIEVHALKTTCRILGITELSEEFYTLEKLGDISDVDSILNTASDTLNRYRSLRPLLKEYEPVRVSGTKAFDKNIVIKALDGLINAVDDFELDDIDTHLGVINSYQYASDLNEYVDRLNALAEGLDYDELAPAAASLRHKLTTNNDRT